MWYFISYILTFSSGYSINLFCGISSSEDASKAYGVTLEMHDHPKGLYKDNVHVTAKLSGSDIIENYFDMNKDCLRDSCTWSPVGKNRTCTRQLIDTDEKLLFTLTRQDQCDNAYEVTIKKNNDVVFKTIMKPNRRVKVVPHAVDQQLNKILFLWYLSLHVDTVNNANRVKLFLDIPYSVHSNQGFLVEGLYHNGATCSSPPGTPGHVKLIVGITVGVFILAVIILTVCLVWKKIARAPKSNLLVKETEDDTAV